MKLEHGIKAYRVKYSDCSPDEVVLAFSVDEVTSALPEAKYHRGGIANIELIGDVAASVVPMGVQFIHSYNKEPETGDWPRLRPAYWPKI